MNNFGKIISRGIAVENTAEIKNFYSVVVGWNFTGNQRGGHEDFMTPDEHYIYTRIMHKNGAMKNLPAVWLNWVSVKDLDASMEKCISMGGRVLEGPALYFGKSRFAVIEDPVGACMAIVQE